ncbi:hypothetical protein ACEQPO_02265 [Bacillus sp. SL00103]
MFQKVQQRCTRSGKTMILCRFYDIQQKTVAWRATFDHLVGFENYPLDQELSGGTMSARLGFSIDVKDGFEQTNFDLKRPCVSSETWTLKNQVQRHSF